MIRSTALAHDLIMVTGNGNHLGKIQGIQIEDWTQRWLDNFPLNENTPMEKIWASEWDLIQQDIELRKELVAHAI